MKNGSKVISTVLVVIVLFCNSIFATNFNEVGSIDQLTREELYNMIDNHFIKLELRNCMRDENLQKYCFDYCKEKGVRYSDFLILAFKESSYRADALNYNEPKVDANGNIWFGASYDVGMMQINIPEKDLETRQNLFNPKINAKNGIYLMYDMKKRYEPKDRQEIMIVYNMGEGGLNKFRNGKIKLSKKWLDRQEEVEAYIEKELRLGINKAIKDEGLHIFKGNTRLLYRD